jgi:tetratricopeptide (TPR) repeat protein
VQLDAGNWKEAIRWQQRAIASFARLGKPVNECIAWLGLADALVAGGKLDSAWGAIKRAETLAVSANYWRGRWGVAVAKAEVLAEWGRLDEAAAELKRARAGFKALDIHESRLETTAAFAARLQGKFRDATRLLFRARNLAEGFPIERKKVLRERLALARASRL